MLARKRGGLERLAFPAKAVVLASGGVGHLYGMTTNPHETNGHGLAMAARAGAVIADAEFVQFHPTALDLGKDPAPLATEALRGEGATLVNSAGERFMESVHPDLELAPRDIVARAIHKEVSEGRGPSWIAGRQSVRVSRTISRRSLPPPSPRDWTRPGTCCRSPQQSIIIWAAS